MAPVPAMVLASAFLSVQPTVLSLFTPLPDLPAHPALGLTLEHLPTGWMRYGGAMGWGWRHSLALALGGFRGRIPLPSPDGSDGFRESGLSLAVTWALSPWMAIAGRRVDVQTGSEEKQDGEVGIRVFRPRWHLGIWMGEGGRTWGVETRFRDRLDTWWACGWQRFPARNLFSLAVRWDLSSLQIVGGVVLEQGPLQTTVYGTVGLWVAMAWISGAMAYQTHPYLEGRWAVSAQAGGSP